MIGRHVLIAVVSRFSSNDEFRIGLDELRDDGPHGFRVRERSQRREVVDVFAARAEHTFGEATFLTYRISDGVTGASLKHWAQSQYANGE